MINNTPKTIRSFPIAIILDKNINLRPYRFVLSKDTNIISMQTLRLALDWTANTNHTGFYVARAKGFYTEKSIEVKITTPEDDGYRTTPAKKLELNEADLALCPLESITSFRTKNNPFPLTAIATIFQDDVSKICVHKNSGILRPKDLDSKKYASYKARYEDHIIKSMIKNDGGSGEIEIMYPEKLGIWNTLLNREAEATWIFDNWEGVMARIGGVELQYFTLADFGIPYSYSPVIATGESTIARYPDTLRAFIEATRKGFLFAQKNPEEATEIILPYIPKHERNRAMVLTSQHYSNKHYGNEDNWGHMDFSKVQLFYDWLYNERLETQIFYAEDTITNALLPSIAKR